MALTLDLIEIVKRVYLGILKEKHLNNLEEIDIDYQKIVKEIMAVITEEIAKGSKILEVANAIIYMLLKKNFFKYENHIAAVIIAYLYLKRGGNTINNPLSIGNLNNSSTLEDIQKFTESWK
jgi:hypothetical protein